MPKRAKGLTAKGILALREAGYHADGNGLYLRIKEGGTKSWVFRYQIAGRRRDMGLGPVAGMGLAEAREKAADLRRMVAAGTDPIDAAAAAHQRTIIERPIIPAGPTFRDVAEEYLESHRSSWKNSKHRQQWENTLAGYAYPVIGDILVSDVSTDHVRQILAPIWEGKTETASRLRGRIETILDSARVRGMRTGENPARWKGHLEHVFPAPGRVARGGHHESMDWRHIPAWWPRLQVADGIAARALEFTILTAARSGEVRGATWNEIDFDSATWTIPVERMKAGREHRVPLSGPAIGVVRKMASIRMGDLVFAGSRPGRPLSDMSLTAVLRRMDIAAVPHGFRASFRTWAADTGHAADVAEAALAHVAGDKVIQAYQRGDLFQRRRQLMDEWAVYVYNHA